MLQIEGYNKKTIQIIILAIILAITLSSCIIYENQTSSKGGDIMLRAALYRDFTGIYIFVLGYDGTLEVFSGEGNVSNTTTPEDIDIIKNDNIVLSEEQLAQFNQIISEIQGSIPEGGFARGAWFAKIELDDATYRFAYGMANDENLDKLVTMLIEASPFEIVDNTGRTVEPIAIN